MDAQQFAALAEPTRLKIVELLRSRPCSVNEVATALRLRQPQASKHLHNLADAGLVTMRPVAQQRLYALNPEPFLQLEDWTRSFHAYWQQRLSSLENHVKTGLIS